MRNISIIAASALSLLMVLLGQPKSEARSAGSTPIEDSSLQKDQDYQRWKKTLLATRTCRDLLRKWAELGLTVHIMAASSQSGETGGADTKDFVFDGGGRLTEVTIILGPEFAKRAPRNAAAYPVLWSLTNVSREVRAVAYIAHEFGHVELARVGGEAYKRQSSLLSEHSSGYAKYGWEGWFKRPEYKRLVAELGATPLEIVRRREIAAEAVAIQVLQDYFGKNMPPDIREAIQSYYSSPGGR